MEVQKKQTSTDKPPILPPPAHDKDAKGQQELRKFAGIAFYLCPSPRPFIASELRQVIRPREWPLRRP